MYEMGGVFAAPEGEEKAGRYCGARRMPVQRSLPCSNIGFVAGDLRDGRGVLADSGTRVLVKVMVR